MLNIIELEQRVSSLEAVTTKNTRAIEQLIDVMDKLNEAIYVISLYFKDDEEEEKG